MFPRGVAFSKWQHKSPLKGMSTWLLPNETEFWLGFSSDLLTRIASFFAQKTSFLGVTNSSVVWLSRDCYQEIQE